jgi:hypothetical protein
LLPDVTGVQTCALPIWVYNLDDTLFWKDDRVRKFFKPKEEKLKELVKKSEEFLEGVAKTVGARKLTIREATKISSDYNHVNPIFTLIGSSGTKYIVSRGHGLLSYDYQPMCEGIGFGDLLCIETEDYNKESGEEIVLTADEIAKRLLLLNNDEHLQWYVETIGKELSRHEEYIEDDV